MTRPCKICLSTNKAEYEDLRLNKHMTYQVISQIAVNKHGEKLSYSMLSRHFNNHVEAYIASRIKSDRLKETYIKEKLKEHIDATVNIVKTLNMLNEQLSKVGSMDDPKARQEAREIAKVLGDVLRTALQYSDKLKPSEEATSEDVYDRLLWSLEHAGVPVEYISKVKEFWSQYKG